MTNGKDERYTTKNTPAEMFNILINVEEITLITAPAQTYITHEVKLANISHV